jgi:DNA-binding transcriptional LysR family regulator
MNCRTLQYIVAVAETGSVQQAAKKCNVTVGTISGQISRLENYLGVKIFRSRAHPAEVNPDANAIYTAIQATVENLKMIKQLAQKNADSTMRA